MAAKSEHQGLQIALILFVMVTVVLAITTFVFYRQADEQAKIADASKKAKEDATTRANDSDARLEFLMHILGAAPLPEAQVDQLKQSIGNDDKMKMIIANYEQHMSTYGAGLTKEELNYFQLLPKMLMNVRQINLGMLNQVADATKSRDERENVQKTEATRTAEALQKQAEAEKKLADELAKYDDDRKKLESQQQTQFADYGQQLKKKDALVAALTAKDVTNEKELKKREQVISDQATTIITMRDEPFEVADGQITWVNQGANTVWINLGLADGLRRQTLFSVYDQADNGVKRTARKASIEVTQVLYDHLAEARIVDDEAANPILPGDQVFSPAWRPGKRIRFALAGFLDIDGDRRSDRNLVRSLLVSSGGQIDSEMHDDGTIEGAGISSGTRYLVLGDTPTVGEGPPDPNANKILASWTKMQSDAKQYGVEVISVEKMLEWVGYRPEVRTIGLGKNADASQFQPRPAEGKSPTSTGTATEKFRERRPPAAKSSSTPAKTSTEPAKTGTEPGKPGSAF